MCLSLRAKRVCPPRRGGGGGGWWWWWWWWWCLSLSLALLLCARAFAARPSTPERPAVAVLVAGAHYSSPRRARGLLGRREEGGGGRTRSQLLSLDIARSPGDPAGCKCGACARGARADHLRGPWTDALSGRGRHKAQRACFFRAREERGWWCDGGGGVGRSRAALFLCVCVRPPKGRGCVCTRVCPAVLTSGSVCVCVWEGGRCAHRGFWLARPPRPRARRLLPFPPPPLPSARLFQPLH
jgi:hypothetical protein